MVYKFIERKSKIIRIIFKKGIIILFVSAALGYGAIKYIDSHWNNFYKDNDEIKITACILTDKTEKDYYTNYEIKVLNGNYSGKKLILKIKKSKEEINFKYGDIINIKGIYKKPETRRNSRGI